MRARRPGFLAFLLISSCGPPLSSSSAALTEDSDGREDRSWLVDDDRVQCPEAPFTSISAAVAAASPGDRIRVCPGLYVENVNVDKRLRLRGDGPAPAARTGDVLVEAVVRPAPPLDVGFLVNANHVLIAGFTILGDGRLAGSFGISVIPPATGALLEENFFAHHDTALSFGFGPGARLPSRIRENRIETSHEGLALRSLTVPDGQPSLLTVDRNVLVSSPNAIELLDVRAARVVDNRLRGCEVGIQVIRSDDNELVDNELAGGGYADVGIELDGSNGNRLRENRVVDHVASFGLLPTGIAITGGGRHWLSRNRTDRNGTDGLRLDATNANVVEHARSNHTVAMAFA